MMQSFYQFLARVDPWCELTSVFRKTVGDEVFERLVAMKLVVPGDQATLFPCGDGRGCKRTIIENPPASVRLPPFTAVCELGPEEGCEHALLETADLGTHLVLPHRLAEVLQRRVGAQGSVSLPDYGAWSLGVAGAPARDVFVALRPSSWRPQIRWFEMFLMERKAAPRPTLVVVPTAGSVDEPVTRQYGPGEKVAIVFLEDLVPTLDGDVVYLPSAPHSVGRVSDSAAPRTRVLEPAPGAQWEDLRVYRVDSDTIKVRIGRVYGQFTYHQLGMASQKNRKPKQEWLLLMTLCEKGKFPRVAKADFDAMKRRITSLRAFLQRVFQLEGDPLPHIRGSSWQPRFQTVDTEPEDRPDIA